MARCLPVFSHAAGGIIPPGKALMPYYAARSDNVLQDGDIIESHYAVTRRNRTIYKRMREYLYELTHRDDLVTAVLPVGDGITVSTKVEENERD